MKNENSCQGMFSIVKGVGVALALSLLFSVLFAVILRVSAIPERAVYPVTQTVKVLCAFLGALASVRGEKGWLRGGAIGILFGMLSYLAFSALGGDFSLSWLIVFELVLTAVSGALGGVIGVNVRRG